MGKNFEVIFREFADSETFVMSRGLLEDYKAKAAQEERERIIKLLESDPEELIDAGGGLRAGYETAIELIKGENK